MGFSARITSTGARIQVWYSWYSFATVSFLFIYLFIYLIIYLLDTSLGWLAPLDTTFFLQMQLLSLIPLSLGVPHWPLILSPMNLFGRQPRTHALSRVHSIPSPLHSSVNILTSSCSKSLPEWLKTLHIFAVSRKPVVTAYSHLPFKLRQRKGNQQHSVIQFTMYNG